MNCPKCGGKFRVLKPMHLDHYTTVRKLQCTKCGHRDMSTEKLAADEIPKAAAAPENGNGKKRADAGGSYLINDLVVSHTV